MKKYDFWGAPNTAELIPADSITLFILVRFGQRPVIDDVPNKKHSFIGHVHLPRLIARWYIVKKYLGKGNDTDFRVPIVEV